jgi:hypothetical protein
VITDGAKVVKQQIPENYDDNPDLIRLFHFKSFFIEKYSLFKLEEMRKRTGESEVLIYLKKALALTDLEIVTRLTNNIIQLHFSDLTSLAINR